MNTPADIQSGYTYKQEILHSLIHWPGILFGIIGILFLNQRGDSYDIAFIARLIYCCSFFVTFLFSALYHSIQQPRVKNLFKILDHISIYFLISGTYTAIVLIYVNNKNGIIMLSLIWIASLIGAFFKMFFIEKSQVFSASFYLLLGLLFLFDIKNFFSAMPPAVTLLVITGAVLYVTGVFFYLWPKWKYSHAVWHLFTLTAGLCHFAAIFFKK
jgi:hemolysin III